MSKLIHDPKKFKVGDLVKVVRKAEDFQGKWRNTWETAMTEKIGKKQEIKSNQEALGYELTDGYDYSSFSLKLIKRAKKK